VTLPKKPAATPVVGRVVIFPPFMPAASNPTILTFESDKTEYVTVPALGFIAAGGTGCHLPADIYPEANIPHTNGYIVSPRIILAVPRNTRSEPWFAVKVPPAGIFARSPGGIYTRLMAVPLE
jgi:hypothetical protein